MENELRLLFNAVKSLLFNTDFTMFGFVFSLFDIFIGFTVFFLIFYALFKIFD